jgi:hypothetical protein
VYSVPKKELKYWYPLYRSTGIGFKKLFLSIVFTRLKKSYFLRHTTRASRARVTDKKNPPAFTTIIECTAYSHHEPRRARRD